MPIDPNRPWGQPSAAAPSVLPALLRRSQEGGSQAKSAAAKTIVAKPAKAAAKLKKSAATAKLKKTAVAAAGS